MKNIDNKKKPGTGEKLQMEYKNIMRTKESVSESVGEKTEGRCISFHLI